MKGALVWKESIFSLIFMLSYDSIRLQRILHTILSNFATCKFRQAKHVLTRERQELLSLG